MDDSLNVEISQETIENLIKLHCAERHSLPYISKASRERREAEESMGLTSRQREPSVVLLIVHGVMMLILIAVSVILIVNRKIPAAVLCILLCIYTSVIVVMEGVGLKTKYAIFAGGELNSIPEKDSASEVFIEGGNLVEIKKAAGGWVYIKFNETYGWVPQDYVFVIE